MNKLTEIVSGNCTKAISLERILNFLKQDAQAMTGRKESKTTKRIMIEISVKEIEDVI